MKRGYKILVIASVLVLTSGGWFAIKKTLPKNSVNQIRNQATAERGWIAKSLKGALTVTGNTLQPNGENAASLIRVANKSENNPTVGSSSDPAGQTLAQTPFSFAVIGDTKSFDKYGTLAQTVKSIGDKNVNLVMTVGDLIQDCGEFNQCKNSYNAWKSVMQPVLSKTYEVVGNHDRHGGAASDRAWQESFNLPTNGPDGFSELAYSFDYGNAHFVVLDTEKPEKHSLGPNQLAWLKKDLDINKQTNIFVFFHEPAFPVGSKIGSALDVNKSDRDALWNILDSHRVTAVFSGHEHIFSLRTIGKTVFPEAKNNIRQFVVGNTAAPEETGPASGLADYSFGGRHFALVKVDQDKTTVELYETGGKLIRSF